MQLKTVSKWGHLNLTPSAQLKQSQKMSVAILTHNISAACLPLLWGVKRTICSSFPTLPPTEEWGSNSCLFGWDDGIWSIWEGPDGRRLHQNLTRVSSGYSPATLLIPSDQFLCFLHPCPAHLQELGWVNQVSSGLKVYMPKHDPTEHHRKSLVAPFGLRKGIIKYESCNYLLVL